MSQLMHSSAENGSPILLDREGRIIDIDHSYIVTYSGSLNQCVLLFYTSYKGETLHVRSHAVKSIWKWKCRPPGGGHFGVGFINQALLAKVSLLDKVSFCGTVKPISTDKSDNI